MSSEFDRSYDAYLDLVEGGCVLVDMAALEAAIVGGAGAAAASECSADNAFYDGKGSAVALRGILGAVLPLALSEFAPIKPLPVSTAHLKDPVARRAGRLLSMVHELHKAGYQRLRICAGHSADGSEWRCMLVPASQVLPDGWTPAVEGMPSYSSGEGKRFFGWEDAEGDDARMLAVKFLARFPEVAREAAGADWIYAGWFSYVLGSAESGILPSFYGGVDFLKREERIPLPPGLGKNEVDDKVGRDVFVTDDEVCLEHLPPPAAEYERLWPFCLTCDGYRRGLRTIDDCFVVAEAVLRGGLEIATMDMLRTTAFIHQRKIKNNSEMPPDPESLRIIRDVVEEIRRRLSGEWR